MKMVNTNSDLKYYRHALLVVMLCFSLLQVLSAQEKIEKDLFANPPAFAKPNVYWYFMDDQISGAGITKDLEQMKSVGIGGALMFNISKYNESGPLNFVEDGVKYLSPAWYRMVKHAANESDRLGLEFGMHNCPGWSATGGPWITPELAMQVVTVSTTEVSGSVHFSAVLAKPPTGIGYFKLTNYWDIAVLAFPTPKSYLINNWSVKAGYKRDVYTLFSSEAEIHKNINVDTTLLDSSMIIPLNSIVNLTSQMDTTGLLTWDVPKGKWTIMRIGYTPTGARSSVPPSGGQGLECDKLSHTALETHWNKFMKKIIDTVGNEKLKIVHIDSYECGCQNWTPDFRQEFQKRRGYDMTPYLPVMTGLVVDNLDVSERFLWDVRQTIGDLFSDEYYGYMAKLAHQNGMLLSAEPYGNGGFRNISIGGKLDIPMGEFWTGSGITTGSNPWVGDPASSAHIYGKKLVAAEAFTSEFTDPGSAWQAHPYSLKQLGDLAFCSGVNRYTLHVYCHQPFTDRSPGYSVRGYGVQFGWTNTWWNQSSTWFSYIARCQYMLQKGLFVADILRFCGEGSPSDGGRLYVGGTACDVCDADAIFNRLSVKNGRIVLPDGMNYKILVLEKSESMTYDLLNKISELVTNGAIIIGKKPIRSPGLKNYPASDLSVQKLADKMWGGINGTTVRMNKFGAGKVYYNESVEKVLASIAVEDFQVQGGDKMTNIKYTHRTTSDEEIYFLSNQNERFETLNGNFRVIGKTPELWYPESGRTVKCPVFKVNSSQTSLPLMFEPYESVFVVFRSAKKAISRINKITRNDQTIYNYADGTTALNKHPIAEVSILSSGALKLIAWEPGLYKLGKKIQVNVASLPKVITLSGKWKITFPQDLGAPPLAVLNSLASWTANSDNGIKYFSGTATYLKDFTVPAEMIGYEKAIYLDLGDVKNIANVTLNGISCGILWKPPFRVDITSAVKTGLNTLEIKVTNNWPNRLIGDKVLGQTIAWKTWDLFYNAASPLLISGLLGPVEIRSAVRWYEFGKDTSE